MKKDFEVSIDVDRQNPELTPVQQNGVFDKINRHIRTLAIWTLGLVGAGEIGCAHTPIAVNIAPDRSERRLCIVWENLKDGVYGEDKDYTPYDRDIFGITGKVQPKIKEEIFQRFSSIYPSLHIVDLGDETFLPPCNLQDPPQSIYWPNTVDTTYFDKIKSKIYHQLPFLKITHQCDDVMVLFTRAVAERGRYAYSYHEQGDINLPTVELTNFMINTSNQAIQKICRDRKSDFFVLSLCDSDKECIEDVAEALEDEISELTENVVFSCYKPETLPPLSFDEVQSPYLKLVLNLYTPYKNNTDPLSTDQLKELNEAIDGYIDKFPHSKESDHVREISQDINTRPQRILGIDQESYGDFIELISAKNDYLDFFKKLRDFRKNHDVQNPRLINYLETLTYQVIEDRKMKTATIANTPIPIYGKKAKFTGISFEPGDPIYIGSWFLGSNGDPFDQSTYHNFAFATTLDGSKQGLIMDEDVKKISGLSQPPPVEMPEGWRISKPGESTFEEGAKMAGEIIVEALPYIGAGTEALAAYVREDLDRRGLTATVEISIAEYTFLSRYPVENVEVTIRQLGGSNSSQTSKTSKENLLETGGRVHFYLAPGWYEISSPLFKYSRTVEVKKGLQVLEFQLR